MIHGLQDLNPEQAAEEEKIKRNSAGVTFSGTISVSLYTKSHR